MREDEAPALEATKPETVMLAPPAGPDAVHFPFPGCAVLSATARARSRERLAMARGTAGKGLWRAQAGL